MRLGVLLLVSAIILIVFGVFDFAFSANKLRKWQTFWVLCVLLAANACPLQVVTELRINPASVVLFFGSLVLCVCSPKRGVLLGLLLGAVGGFAIYALKPLSLGVEPGVVYGLSAAAIALPLLGRGQTAVLAAAFAPLVADCAASVADVLYCGYTVVQFSSPAMFDAQIAGTAFTLLALLAVRALRARHRTQKRPDPA